MPIEPQGAGRRPTARVWPSTWPMRQRLLARPAPPSGSRLGVAVISRPLCEPELQWRGTAQCRCCGRVTRCVPRSLPPRLAVSAAQHGWPTAAIIDTERQDRPAAWPARMPSRRERPMRADRRRRLQDRLLTTGDPLGVRLAVRSRSAAIALDALRAVERSRQDRSVGYSGAASAASRSSPGAGRSSRPSAACSADRRLRTDDEMSNATSRRMTVLASVSWSACASNACSGRDTFSAGSELEVRTLGLLLTNGETPHRGRCTWNTY